LRPGPRTFRVSLRLRLLRFLAIVQSLALLLLLARLAPGRRRRPPVEPAGPREDTSVTVLVPTLNEAERIGGCVAGLIVEGAPLHEIIIIDSHSTDGTAAVIQAAARGDRRVRVVEDPPLPDEWIGKMWAMQHGLSVASGDWILGIDADVSPEPGMVAAVVGAAEEHGFDVVSFSPRFAAMTRGEEWLHPSLLLTLVYRFGASGTDAPRPTRVLANGQCFLVRRALLESHGGFAPARGSFADDTTLARFYAGRDARVGFLDGSRLYTVRSYGRLATLWREWGRSLDLRDATPRAQQWFDVAYLLLVQGVPLPLLATAGALGNPPLGAGLVAVNVALMVVRVLMLWPLSGAYERRRAPYWLSPLSDPFAAVRILWSTVRRPTTWRGRRYDGRTPEIHPTSDLRPPT
jgi:dolichol-phosphate mannosyltransferase